MKTQILTQRGTIESPLVDPKRRSSENKIAEVQFQMHFFTGYKKTLRRKIDQADKLALTKKLKSLSNNFSKGMLKYLCNEIPVDIDYMVKFSIVKAKRRKGK